jgi:hypothetical protein
MSVAEFTHQSVTSHTITQCDESRPTCTSCLRGQLRCAYELPAGQTRTQALIESQKRLREELHSHVSLIHALRCVDPDAATQTLKHLRQGSYDGTLLGKNPASRRMELGSQIFSWERSQCKDQESLDAGPGVLWSTYIIGDPYIDRAMGPKPQLTCDNADHTHRNDQHQITSTYRTASHPFPPRQSLDKILWKPEKRSIYDRNVPSH